MPTPKAKYKKQSPWVGTYLQRAYLDYEAEHGNLSLAQIVRAEVNDRYGIDPDREEYLDGVKITSMEQAREAVANFYAGRVPQEEAAL
jgi:hypothetical protein